MARMCRPVDGIFPTPKQIKFDCSCPDGASMCNHLAAVLYGVGSRLDRQPELLSALRKAGSIDNATARSLTGLESIAVRVLLQGIAADGLARREGLGRGTRYVSRT